MIPLSHPLKKSALVATALLTLSVIQMQAGRYEELRARIADDPHLIVAAATFHGDAADESYVDAVELPDGRILAVGNVTPPEKSSRNRNGTAPFIQAYAADLDRELGKIEFPSDSARFTAAKLSADGSRLYVAGIPGEQFAQLERTALRSQGEGDAFILAMDTTNGGIAWVTRVDLKQPPHRLFTDSGGIIYAAAHRKGEASLASVRSDGQPTAVHKRQASDRGGFFTTDPSGKHVLYGTDRNTHTGREPWRQPYFYMLKADTLSREKPEKSLELWQWKPNKEIRGDAKGGALKLESDSSIVDAAYGKEGSLFIAAWSDGGNSVMTRQPDSLKAQWKASGLGVTTWGMRGANGLSWLLRLDPHTYQVTTGTQWVTFIPKGFDNGPGNWPNALHIEQLEVLDNGSPALTGKAWTGLVPTPNAFWHRPESMTGKYGGHFVTVFSPNLDEVLFSSYLPGYERSKIIPISDGLLVVGTTAANDGREGVRATPPATENAAQPSFGGGETDGHLIRLRFP